MRLTSLFFLFVSLFLVTGNRCFAQSGNATAADSATQNSTEKAPELARKTTRTDTVKARAIPWQPNPKKAGLYAALIPGLGQIYNRQYWKIPIVYTGLTVAGYFIVKNSTDYTTLRKAYVGRISARINHTTATDDFVGIYDETQLKQLQDDQNRIMNMTILFSSLAYAMQVLDAVTSAHLRNFDISRDISLHVRPTLTPYGPGIGLAMGF